MIVLDMKDARPLYEQVVEKMKQLILCGVLTENEKLPAVRSLAMELSINPNTIQKAYGELERQGFIYSVKGRGTFVSSTANLLEYRKEELKEQIMLLVREAESIGISREEIIRFLSESEK